MKAFLWLVILGCFAFGGYVVFMTIAPGDTRMVAIAFGNPEEASIEMHIELSMLMAGEDTFAYADEFGNVDWTRWAGAHYVITDDAGNQVEFKKQMQSNLITDRDTRGLHDSFLIGSLNPGSAYRFTYIPVVGEAEQYLYEFVAPTAKTDRSRVSMDAI